MGTNGGFVLSPTSSRFLQDLHVGGTIETKTFHVKGSGPTDSSRIGEAFLIGNKESAHLRMGYSMGHSWIQSGLSHLAINPTDNNPVSIGTSQTLKKLTVGGGDVVVEDILHVGGNGRTFLSTTQLRFGHGGGWESKAEKWSEGYLHSVGDVPVYTTGSGSFTGNVGIGGEPSYPTFRLQVHSDYFGNEGTVMVTDKEERGIAISQTKTGAVLKSWNADTNNHEALVIDANPLIMQPRSGAVNFGTNVQKKRMQIHVNGNMFVNGKFFATKNLHVRDHATFSHLILPMLSLKNEPQGPEGDTLVIGHMKKTPTRDASDKSGPVGGDTNSNAKMGTNLRFGFDKDYTWIQVHGEKQGRTQPLVLNSLGNSVSIGSTSPDLRQSLFANGHGYVLGSLYVQNGNKLLDPALVKGDSDLSSFTEKLETPAKTVAPSIAANVTFATPAMSESDAMAALKESDVRRNLLSDTIAFINVP